jgi:hypothetical protein
MRNWKKHAAVIAVAAPLALWLPACSHSTENTMPDDTGAVAPASNPAETPDAGTDTGTMNGGDQGTGTDNSGSMNGGSGSDDTGTPPTEGTDSSGGQ